jgi:hypothetical protein
MPVRRPSPGALLALGVIALPALTACDGTSAAIAGGVTVGSLVVLGRTPADAVVSLISGRDCSAVRLARHKSYCAAMEPPPGPQPYCTRSLGQVDCWTSPPLTMPARPGIADGRAALTPEQDAQRTRRWPGLF